MLSYKELQATIGNVHRELCNTISMLNISIEEVNEIYVISYEDDEGKYAYIDEEDLTHFIDMKTGGLYINIEKTPLPYQNDRFYLRLQSASDLLYYTKFVKETLKSI